MPASPRTSPRPQRTAEPSRLLPLSIAGVTCFLLALVLGYGGWYLFGTHRRNSPNDKILLTQTPPVPTPATPPPTMPPTPAKFAPAGELPVKGGEIALGGGDSGEPLRRENVEPFLIAETEVTNEQYREFVQDAKHKAPTGWRDNTFAAGSTREPVTEMTYQDAVDECK